MTTTITTKRVNLIKARKQKKLTIRAVAKQVGVSKSTYNNYELGKRTPRRRIMFDICKFYNQPRTVLFAGESLESFKVGKMKGGVGDVE